MAKFKIFTIRMPLELHEWLRKRAFETRQSINQLIIQALEAFRKKSEKK